MDAAALKIQSIFRKKRVFTNTGLGFKTSASQLTAKIVTFNVPTNFRAVFDSTPKGFSEITGYKGALKKPVVRWIAGQGWIGDASGVTKVIAKRGAQTIVLTDKYFDVMGLGNYEAALFAIVRNDWAPKFLLKAPPLYKKIDGIFYVNRPFVLGDLRDELKKLPASMVEKIGNYDENVGGVPAIVLKLKQPKWTYQFFKNGTVLFTGIKDPSARDAPRKLFKEFFTEKYDLIAMLAMNLSKSPAIRKPGTQGAATKKAKLAERYELAGTWNALKAPPRGFYIRPGTNGKPRFYPWLKQEKESHDIGEAMPHVTVKYHKMALAGVGPKVVKAFQNAGRPIPKSTLNAFREAGFPLNVNAEVKSVSKLGNRRAPGWNATKPGFYVRPGPGQQPYWFAIPKGTASGRKTVVAAYAKAGRVVPKAVRNIFGLENVGSASPPVANHRVAMGLDGILRIDDRQATRLTKAELLAIARNMNIAAVNAKMAPAELIAYIQNRAGVKKASRNYDVLVNGTFYKFLSPTRNASERRVEKTSNRGIRTTRNWATIPVTEQNKIGRAFLNASMINNYMALNKEAKFDVLRMVRRQRTPAVGPSPSPKATPSPSSAGSNNGNFGKELEFTLMLQQNLGNNYIAGNEATFMKIYGKLPVGTRGDPLKANVNRAFKKFVKETRSARANTAPRARFMSRIEVPNWMPPNKVGAYRNLVTNLAFQKPKPSQKNLRAAIRNWINRTIPLSPARPARNVENIVTGEITRTAAYVPKPRATPPIPKRTPPANRSPKPKKPARAVPANLMNAVTNLGLPTGPRNLYTWANLERAGLNKKFKKFWV